MRQRILPNCYRCDEEITFDDDILSDSGKMIPLDAETHAPHDCREYGNEIVKRLTVEQRLKAVEERLAILESKLG